MERLVQIMNTLINYENEGDLPYVYFIILKQNFLYLIKTVG